MRKKFIISALTLIIFALCSIGLFACTTTQNNEHSHSWSNWTSDGANTHSHNCECGESETKPHNLIDGYCSNCGYTNKITDEHTHSWSKWNSDGATTHSHTCACGESETNNHNWNNGEITKNATCKDTGIKTFTCTDCHETKTETIEKSTVHSYGIWSTDGTTTHTHTCSVCNNTETEIHNWNDGIITQKATCKDTGIKTFTCTECGEIKTETIEKSTVHSYGIWSTNGTTTHTHICSVCSKEETENHNWNDGVITKQATCKEIGIKTFTCTDCDENKTQTIEKLNTHSFNEWTSDGETTHTHSCFICGENEAANHNWNNGIVTKNATCKDTGIKTFTCTDCHETKTETIEKITVHSWSKWTSVNEENHTHSCSVCGESETNSHNFVGEVCKGCGFSYLPATVTSVDNATMDYANSSIEMFVNKTINSVNLSTMVKVSPNSFWRLYTADSILIETKFANLNDGNNTYLIVVSSSDGLYDNTYTLTIYKSFEISVNYYDVYNDLIYTETVDTGCEYLVSYIPDITGYTFNYWKLDGEQTTKFTPYTDKNLYADCSANGYLFILNPDGGYINMHGLLITFDSGYALPVTTKKGYIFVGWSDGDKLITDSNGLSLENSKYAEQTEVTAQWCKVIIESNITSAGTVTQLNGAYIAGEDLTITAESYLGYTWQGWYNGENLISSDLSFNTSMPSQDTVYTAKWQISEEMQIFEFNSNKLTCTITGLKDSSIIEIIVPDYVTYIKDKAFKECSNLTSITIPFIGNSASGTYFSNIFDKMPSSLKTVEITSVEWIVGYAFMDCSGLTNIIIPDSVKSIGISAFKNCSGLTSITIPNSVKTIGEFAFHGCSSLTDVKIGNGVTAIDSYVFRDCSSLTNIKLPESVKSIGQGAFGYCSSLISITIPDSVTSIGSFAFYECSGLISVTIPESVSKIEQSVFSECNSLTVYCEAASKPSGWVNDWKGSDCPVIWDYKNNEVATDGYIYTVIDGVRYSLKGNNATVARQSTAISGDIVIPENVTYKNITYSVTSIGSFAFYKCSGLISVTIPESVTSIGYSAFFTRSGFTIYCEVDSKPSGWDNSWNFYNYPVIWNYKNQD